MKRILSLLICGLFVILSAAAMAAPVKKVAVLPFAMNSAENIEYIREGVWDMLASRISVDGKIEVMSRSDVAEALGKAKRKGISMAEAYGIGKRLKADYVVFGSITKIGSSISIDGKLADVAAKKTAVSVFAQTKGMDEVVPKINDFAKRVDYHILGEVPSTFGDLPSPAAALPPAAAPAAAAYAAGQAGRAPIAEQALRSRQGTYTSIINPDFIMAPQALTRKGFWMSARQDEEFRGMDIGDVDGDGRNEIVTITFTDIMIYRKEGKTLKKIHTIPGKSYVQLLSVDVADINGNGIPEIIISAVSQGIAGSFALEHKNGKYERIVSDVRMFLRVLRASGAPMLIGQQMGTIEPFQSPIYRMVWDGKKYRQDSRIRAPLGLSVFDFILDKLDPSGPEVVVAIDDLDYLRVYEKTERSIEKIHTVMGSKELLWKSDDQYGGTTNYFDLPSGMKYSNVTNEKIEKPAVNIRLTSYDVDKDGRKDLILIKNISSTGRVFKSLKAFTACEIYAFEWGGLGIAEKWRTKKIQGYVSDIQIADIDNDGKKEVVLTLIVNPNIPINMKSVIVAYSLDPENVKP